MSHGDATAFQPVQQNQSLFLNEKQVEGQYTIVNLSQLLKYLPLTTSLFLHRASIYCLFQPSGVFSVFLFGGGADLMLTNSCCLYIWECISFSLFKKN